MKIGSHKNLPFLASKSQTPLIGKHIYIMQALSRKFHSKQKMDQREMILSPKDITIDFLFFFFSFFFKKQKKKHTHTQNQISAHLLDFVIFCLVKKKSL
jgi:hypothetical protein